MAYRHGIYTSETATNMPETYSSRMVQVVIGTAPVHWLADYSKAVNTPVLCESITDCRRELGYSDNFEKYTLCQSMYINFMTDTAVPVVFINVFDPDKHCGETTEISAAVSDNTAVISDNDAILSTISVKSVDRAKYSTLRTDGGIVISFEENPGESVTVEYKKADMSKITESDIIGAYDPETEQRTGFEVIRSVYPMLGVIPFIITAPGWSGIDTVAAVMAVKAREINGRFKAVTIIDLESLSAKTRKAAIAQKKERTFDENCIAVYPMIKKGGYKLKLSAYLSAFIMRQAEETNGVICSNPSNKRINIENCILADGTNVFYDTEDGNELNAEGIMTVINRNGLYLWGNNTAAYPAVNDPKDRFIMTKLSFNYIENDFIERYFSKVDNALDSRMVDDIITEENIILSSYTAAGYIAGGNIYYNAGDNPDEEILDGHFTFRTSLAANIPGEVIDNIFSFDIDTLKAAVLGDREEE